MSTARTTSALICAIGLGAAHPMHVTAQDLQPDAEGFLVATPDDLRPAAGERRVNVVGDPSKEGLYVIRLTWAPHTGSKPHYHDQARYIQVLKGTWYVSTGAASDVYDPDHMRAVEEGSFIYEPPYGHHYDMAKDEEVVVQIWGMGPVSSTSIPQPDDTAANGRRP